MFRRADSLHEGRVNGNNPWGVCLKPVPSSRSQSAAPSRDKRPSFLNVILRPVQSLVDRMKARADKGPIKVPPKKTEETYVPKWRRANTEPELNNASTVTRAPKKVRLAQLSTDGEEADVVEEKPIVIHVAGPAFKGMSDSDRYIYRTNVHLTHGSITSATNDRPKATGIDFM